MERNPILAQYDELEHELQALLATGGFSSAANMRLERITQLVQLLGNPHQAYPTIHITGTSGKGSTATMAAAILTAAGYRTGLFLSPRLQILNECYQIDGQWAATSRLAAAYAVVKQAIRQVAAENPWGRPSNFEAQVALALLLFQQAQVDVAVIEVGLGGALDATNVIQAQVGVLTNIGLDHTEILGATIEQIAQDKAGIIKPGQIVISGVTQPSTQQIVAARCAAVGATLWQAGKAFTVHAEEHDGTLAVVLPARRYAGLRLKLQGDFQRDNAACAVAAVHAFTGGVPDAAVRTGLAQAAIPGRMECVQQAPVVILDGAHNGDKMRAAAAAIDAAYANRRRIVVVACKADKPYGELLPILLAHADLLIVTTFQSKEGLQPIPAAVLAAAVAALAPELALRVEPDPLAATRLALAVANPEDLIWVTGSLYLVGNVREHWYPAAELIVQAERTA